jgi:hypothetical protein
VDAHIFTGQAENFKQTLSACQKTDGQCFLEEEKSADSGITQQGSTVMSEVISWEKTKDNAQDHYEQKDVECWHSV